MIWLVQLVFDCSEPDDIMQFWGRALNYRNPMVGVPDADIAAFRAANPQFDGRGRIDDHDLRRAPVYIQRVPEPKTEPNRVRLEIATPDKAATSQLLVDLGAAHFEDGAYADIERNEFSLTDAPNDANEVWLRSIEIDASDPARVLDFWSQALGYEADAADLRCDPVAIDRRWTGVHFEVGDTTLLHICGAGAAPGPARYDLTPGLRFVPSSSKKQVKNRLHIDLNSTDVESDRSRLEALGATVIRWDTDRVLTDPEGNEFCLSGFPSP